MHPSFDFFDWPLAHFELREEWGATKKNYRLRIRHGLRDYFLKLKHPHSDTLLDLKSPPQLSGFAISVSHCPLAGGFAVTQKPNVQIGLDIEVAGRISKKVIARVCGQDEITQSPLPAALWVAKEATVKSLLGQAQPLTLSQIKIDFLPNQIEKAWPFSACVRGSIEQKAKGLVWCSGRLIVGLAEKSSQL